MNRLIQFEILWGFPCPISGAIFLHLATFNNVYTLPKWCCSFSQVQRRRDLETYPGMLYTAQRFFPLTVILQKKKSLPTVLGLKKKSESHSVLGANTRDPTPNKAVREKTWRARPIRFSGVSKRPAHEIPPMTRSRGESLTGKACLNGLLPNFSDTGRKAFPDLFPNKNQFRTLINKFPRWWYIVRLFRVKGEF